MAEALLADSIGPALLVILHTLAPAERLADRIDNRGRIAEADLAILGR